MPSTNLTLLGDEKFEQIKEDIIQVIEAGKKRDEGRKKVEGRFDKAVFKLDTESLLVELRLADNSWFLKKILGRSKVAKKLKGYLKAAGKLDPNELQDIIMLVQTVQEQQGILEKNDGLMKNHFSELWKDMEGKWTELEHALEWLSAFRTYIKEENDSFSYLKNAAQRLQEERHWLTSIQVQEQLTSYKSVFEEVMKHWGVIQAELEAPNFHEPDQPQWVRFMEEKATRLKRSLNQLKDMCHFSRATLEAEQAGLGHVVAPYTKGELAHHELMESYLFGFYRMRIDEEIASQPTLAQFSEANFERNIQRFYQLDDEMSELTKLEVYVKLMQRVPNLMSNLIQSSEPGILLKAIKSKGRGISIRQLFERIPNLLPKIKPCMLMSPLAVSQYLDPTLPEFDLVIFDEASQLPTSEAIGAMARGKNVIVVGDPKQLPPTSFFRSQDSEEDFDTQDLESVLDDCLSIRMPQKHLRWHYRSEHESLISFSNNHYYDNKLITFPSIDDLVSRVRFRKVDGIYDRGRTKHNKKEAIAVVDEIFTRLLNPLKQHESIGVVTFSQVQQTLIEDLIDDRLKLDPTLERYFSDQVQEPVFVKNLENVQGDERDVILFTVGYGPDETGHMTLNFGPLNRDGGWRRLNVAVSRAKKEMIIFASMEPDQINLSRTKAEGVHGLRAFMEFAKRGSEPLLLANRQNQAEPNSRVIMSKIQTVLQENGYQVERNVGSSDFKIDLAIVDKDRDGQYLAAVQLDGHHYANTVIIRDRDKLRDMMLARLGWNVIKVWSQEWWYDEKKQIANLLMKLQKAEQSPRNQLVQKAVVEEVKRTSIHEKISQLIIEDDEEESEIYYEQAVIEDVGLSTDLFYTVEGLPVIRTQIEQIITQEAPVSSSQITKQITNAWGFTRSGAKIEQIIQQMLMQVNAYETKEDKGNFFWKSEEQYQAFNTFRMSGDYRRNLEDISTKEYAAGILSIMNAALRLPKSDLIRELSKQLGFRRSGKVIEGFVQEALDLLAAKGLITEDGNGNVAL